MSETTNLKLKKHDNVTTNTEQFDIENYLNGNWDKVDEESGEVRTRLDILETDNTTNKQDINELKAKTIKCLQEVETPTPVSGESIDISDSAEMRCELKISGNSVQDGEPTPENPVDIKSCGDNVNMFDVSASLEYKWLSSNSGVLENSSDKNIVSDYIKVDIGQTYVLNVSSSFSVQVWSYETNTSETGKTKLIAYSPSIKTFIPDANYIRFAIGGGDAISIKNTVQLEKGTVATPYSSYGQGCINEVICNRNFINVFAQYSSGYSGTINGIKYTVNEDGTVAVNGTSTSTSWTFFQIIRDITVGYNLNSFVDGNTYYLIGAPEGSTSSTYCLQFWDEKNTTFYDYGNGIAVKRIDSTRFNVAIGIAPGVTVNNVVFKPMLLKGDYTGKTLPEYEEHKEQTYTIPTQQPFRAIGDTRDTFIKKDGKWYERHYCNKYTFTGNEKVSLQNNGKRIYVNSANNNILKPINPYKQPDKYKQLLCNYAEAVTPDDTWIGIQGISYDRNASSGFEGFGISINKFTTVEQYLNWFKEKYNEGTPVYVDYVLATPTDIECTEEQSTILFDIEQNAKTYKNITHIYSTDEVSANKEVTYKKDIETLFNKI